MLVRHYVCVCQWHWPLACFCSSQNCAFIRQWRQHTFCDYVCVCVFFVRSCCYMFSLIVFFFFCLCIQICTYKFTNQQTVCTPIKSVIYWNRLNAATLALYTKPFNVNILRIHVLYNCTYGILLFLLFSEEVWSTTLARLIKNLINTVISTILFIYIYFFLLAFNSITWNPITIFLLNVIIIRLMISAIYYRFDCFFCFFFFLLLLCLSYPAHRINENNCRNVVWYMEAHHVTVL